MHKVPFAASQRRLQQGKQQTSTPPPISRRIAQNGPQEPTDDPHGRLNGPHGMETIMKYLAILPILIMITACSTAAPQFTLDKPGAACLRGRIDTDNPIAEASTQGVIIEINTGDGSPVTPEQVSATAIAMGCTYNAE